jgi:D-methionine transport system permease protein
VSFENIYWGDISAALLQTLAMVSGALVLTVLLGLPLGILLFLTGRRQLFDQPLAYGALSVVIGVIRSVPFIILLIVLMPVTVIVTGTSLGIRGVIFPLVIGTAPFFARLVETALRDVDRGIIEASEAMGATTLQTILRAVLPEALPSLVAAVTVTAIVLVATPPCPAPSAAAVSATSPFATATSGSRRKSCWSVWLYWWCSSSSSRRAATISSPAFQENNQ